MNRLPAEFFRMPPSPRTLSVTRMPRTDGGHTMPVGWNCTNSMFTSVAPACIARLCPSPVYSHELEVTLYDFPMPPVASTTDGACQATKRPDSRQYPNAPVMPSWSVRSRVPVHSMYTSIPSATVRCCRVRMSSRPVRSPTCASRAYRCPPKSRWLIRPSGVRSNSAPQSSSSRTRSGASWACSCAMRQWLSIFPPRMVSRKCTRQLSSGHRLAIAAAIPPSAITVCAFPSSDLQTTAVRAPLSWASIAARRPAPPAPTTTTSYSCFSSSISRAPSEEAKVGDRVRGEQEDVEVGERDAEQRRPGELHVVGVQPRDDRPEAVAQRVPREVVEPAADDVPAGVAGQRVEPQQAGVGQQDERPETHVPPGAGLVAEGQHDVVGEDEVEDEAGVEEVPVHVLEDQREPRLAGVPLVRLGHRTGRRRQPEGPVVGLAVVVAGQPEAQREHQDVERRRDPRRAGDQLREGVALAAGGDAGRVEGRDVGLGEVVRVLEGAERRVDDEQ